MKFINLLFKINILQILILTTSLSFSHAKIKHPTKNVYSPTIEITGRLGYGNNQTKNRNLLRLGTVFPTFQQAEKYMLFISLIGVKDNSNRIEGNFGLGYRFFINPKIFMGIYGFYDLHRTINNNLLHQATFGLEGISANLEFRTNIYLPHKKQHDAGTRRLYEINYANNITNFRISEQRLFEVCMHGFDIELGGTFSRLPKLSSFISFYHFNASQVNPINGIRIRNNIHLQKWISIEFINKYRKNLYTGYIGVRISWNSNKNNKIHTTTNINNKITQLPIRDIDIVYTMKNSLPIPICHKSTSGISGAILEQQLLSSRDIIHSNVPIGITNINNANGSIANIGIISSNKISFVASNNPDEQANNRQLIDNKIYLVNLSAISASSQKKFKKAILDIKLYSGSITKSEIHHAVIQKIISTQEAISTSKTSIHEITKNIIRSNISKDQILND
ncbi:MAG: inverse autotransporter beta domain-containing protein, partial [Legionellales bacterium]|nr:inverse autotransporter beta domain-containing protein [Legionellales bacterium]